MNTQINEYWSNADSDTATAMGWNLFETDGKLMLQRCDKKTIFETDAQAIWHVMEMAVEGDALARKALKLDASLLEIGRQYAKNGSKIMQALAHVRSFYPKVTQVLLGNGFWYYTTANLNAPDFGYEVSDDVLDAAICEHYKLGNAPCIITIDIA